MTVYRCVARAVVHFTHDTIARAHFVRKRVFDTVLAEVNKLRPNENSFIGMVQSSINSIMSEREDDSGLGLGDDVDIEQSNSAVLVEGAPGSGMASVVSLVTAAANKISVRLVHIQLKQTHKTVSHGCLRELFVTLVGPDNFRSSLQRRKVIAGLVQSFSSSSKMQMVGAVETYIRCLYAALQVGNDNGFEDDSVTPRRTPREITPRRTAGTGNVTDTCTDSPAAAAAGEGDSSITNRPGEFSQDLQEIVLCKALNILLEKEPTVIVIDDMQWADELSWTGVNRLLRTKVDLLIVMMLQVGDSSSLNEDDSPKRKTSVFSQSFKGLATASNKLVRRMSSFKGGISTHNLLVQRKAEAKRRGFPDIYGEMLNNRRIKRVVLYPLSAVEAKKYVCQCLRLQNISDEIVDSLMQISSGNMYWLREAALFIAERGEDACIDAIRGTTSPLKVLITCRLDTLAYSEQAVLKFACITGEEFYHSIVSSSIPQQFRRTLSTSLDSLIRKGFLYVSNEDPLMFRFLNQTIRGVLYSMVPHGYVEA